MKFRLTTLSVAAVVAFAASVARATAPTYGYLDIGPGAPYVYTQADLGIDGYVINGHGQIVGNSTKYVTNGTDPPLPDSIPFLWTPGSGMTFLPNSTSGGAFEAYAVNNGGQVVGSGYGGAFYWTSAGGVTIVNNTADGYAVNDSGLMVGDGGPNNDAFAYNIATSTLYDCGPDTSSLNGVSSSGLAVGVSYGSRVFLWTVGGGATTIPGLNFANAISSNGTYVAANAGGNGVDPVGGPIPGGAAVYNTVTHVTTQIGPDGICWSVNSNGTAVGNTTIDGSNQPFVYSGGTTYALANQLAFALPSGWTLFEAMAVNAAQPDGNGGYYPHVLLLTVPGDANFDGKVDINDLTIVLAHYGQTGATWAQGEFTGDGTVDINDLTIVLAHYNDTAGSSGAGSPAAVPEPGALALLAAALAGVAALASCARRRS